MHVTSSSSCKSRYKLLERFRRRHKVPQGVCLFRHKLNIAAMHVIKFSGGGSIHNGFLSCSSKKSRVVRAYPTETNYSLHRK